MVRIGIYTAVYVYIFFNQFARASTKFFRSQSKRSSKQPLLYHYDPTQKKSPTSCYQSNISQSSITYDRSKKCRYVLGCIRTILYIPMHLLCILIPSTANSIYRPYAILFFPPPRQPPSYIAFLYILLRFSTVSN